MDWDMGSLRSLEKAVGQKFSHKHFFNFYCTAISKLPHLGQAWDKSGLSKTFHGQEESLLGMSPFPNKLDGAHLLVLGAVVWGFQIPGCRETPFSTGPHTLSALSHTGGVGCRSISVSVRSLKFQQQWFKAQFSHSQIVLLSDPSAPSQGQEARQWALGYPRASGGMTGANRDSPLTTAQLRGSSVSSRCTNMELGFSCAHISTDMESFVVSTWWWFKRCRISCLVYQGMDLL